MENTSPSLSLLHMAVCMCACKCAYVRVCVFVCVHICACLCACMCGYVRICVLVSVRMAACMSGRGGSLVDSITFHPKGRGFESRSSRHVGTLGKSFTHLPVAHWHETLTQYPCCVGSASE